MSKYSVSEVPSFSTTEKELQDLEEMQRATLNILEDFDDEKNGLEDFQRATFNILEDFNLEKRGLEEFQRATFNILEDFNHEKQGLEEFQRATFNILEDFNHEKQGLEEFQRATFNILEDLNDEKQQLEQTQRATLNILEDFNTEKERLEDTQKATLNILEDFNAEKEKVTQAYEALQKEVNAREEAEKSRFYLASIVDSAEDAVFSKSLDGTLTSWNNGAEKLYGYTAEEAIGQHISFLVPEGHKDEVAKFLKRVMKNQKVEHYETERVRKDGSVVSVSLTLSPIKDGQGRTIGVSTIARDITEKKRAEENLRRARDHLELRVKERTQQLEHEREALARSNADLEEFAYIASHDLKTPLRNIQSLSRWIEEDLGDTLTGEPKKNMEMLKSRVRQLNTLLDDLLAYSRIGRMSETVAIVDSYQLVTDIVSLFENDELDLHVSIDKSLPKFATQKAVIELVFRNLINNAIKHHDQNIIHLQIKCVDKQSFYTFSVSDDGPGIPEQYHKRIFGMFKTLKTRDKVEGSGMGLAIIKRAIESQGGQIRVKSKEGTRGSAFSFDIKKLDDDGEFIQKGNLI
ncbi:sensor histidine kinase [Thalassotalea fusca]